MYHAAFKILIYPATDLKWRFINVSLLQKEGNSEQFSALQNYCPPLTVCWTMTSKLERNFARNKIPYKIIIYI